MGRNRNPEWPAYVRNVLQKGDLVHQGNNNVFYLFRVPEGSTNMKPVYYGRIMPDGSIVPAKHHRRGGGSEVPPTTAPSLFVTEYTLSQDDVWEFGFSHLMLSVCTPIMREMASADADMILREIILSVSPRSYLQTIDVGKSKGKHQLIAWKKKLAAKLRERDSGWSYVEMYQKLGTILIFRSSPESEGRISHITDEQMTTFRHWNVSL